MRHRIVVYCFNPPLRILAHPFWVYPPLNIGKTPPHPWGIWGQNVYTKIQVCYSLAANFLFMECITNKAYTNECITNKAYTNECITNKVYTNKL